MSDREPVVENGAAAPAPPVSTGPLLAEPTRRRRTGCVSRFLSALLLVIITSAIALAAVAGGLLYLGFTPDAAERLAGAQAQVGTLQAQNAALQTEVAAQSQRGSTDHEVLSEINRQVQDITQLREQLRQEREASASQNATLVAEARSSRDTVALFATAEAGRAALLLQLEQRSARVERFLQRLSDIAGDTAIDLGAAPVSPQPPAPTTITELSPTPAAQPSTTSAPSPASTAAPTGTPSPAPTSTAASAGTTATTPTRTPRASPSPTAGR